MTVDYLFASKNIDIQLFDDEVINKSPDLSTKSMLSGDLTCIF